jgi:hypothetical protein
VFVSYFLPAAHTLDRFSIHGLPVDIPSTTSRLARLSGPQNIDSPS